jgi:hypothetical protein
VAREPVLRSLPGPPKFAYANEGGPLAAREPLSLKRGTLGKSGKQGSKRIVVRNEYGALFEPATDEDDAVDEDEEDEDEDSEEVTARAGRKARSNRHEILAGQPLLAVRVALYDARRRGDFEPQLQFAVMSDWALGDSPVQRDEGFTLQSYMLKRVPRALADQAGVSKGTRIRTAAAARPNSGYRKGKDRKLTCSAPEGIEAVPLYSVSSAEALEGIANRMKEMWTAAVGIEG